MSSGLALTALFSVIGSPPHPPASPARHTPCTPCTPCTQSITCVGGSRVSAYARCNVGSTLPPPPPILELAHVRPLDRKLPNPTCGCWRSHFIGPTPDYLLANECPVGNNVLIPEPMHPRCRGLIMELINMALRGIGTCSLLGSPCVNKDAVIRRTYLRTLQLRPPTEPPAKGRWILICYA